MLFQGIGEPPFLLAISVHTALQEAVISARKDAGAEGHYQLPCPATVDKIRMACCDKLLQKVTIYNILFQFISLFDWRDHCGHDCMVVGFTTTWAISAYHL